MEPEWVLSGALNDLSATSECLLAATSRSRETHNVSYLQRLAEVAKQQGRLILIDDAPQRHPSERKPSSPVLLRHHKIYELQNLPVVRSESNATRRDRTSLRHIATPAGMAEKQRQAVGDLDTEQLVVTLRRQGANLPQPSLSKTMNRPRHADVADRLPAPTPQRRQTLRGRVRQNRPHQRDAPARAVGTIRKRCARNILPTRAQRSLAPDSLAGYPRV